jgi:hypothetical protein
VATMLSCGNTPAGLRGLMANENSHFSNLPVVPSYRPACRAGAEGEEMRAARLQELQEMAAKLLATVGELPPGQDHHNALREIGRFCAQLTALQGEDLRPAQLGPKAKGK